jgi:hypothetical protein
MRLRSVTVLEATRGNIVKVEINNKLQRYRKVSLSKLGVEQTYDEGIVKATCRYDSEFL